MGHWMSFRRRRKHPRSLRNLLQSSQIRPRSKFIPVQSAVLSTFLDRSCSSAAIADYMFMVRAMALARITTPSLGFVICAETTTICKSQPRTNVFSALLGILRKNLWSHSNPPTKRRPIVTAKRNGSSARLSRRRAVDGEWSKKLLVDPSIPEKPSRELHGTTGCISPVLYGPRKSSSATPNY